jgi:hypothetical protein
MSDTRICLPRRSTHNGTDWRDHAACRDIDPELFFPIGNAAPALLQTHRKAQTGVRRLPGTPAVRRQTSGEAHARSSPVAVSLHAGVEGRLPDPVEDISIGSTGTIPDQIGSTEITSSSFIESW